MDHRHHLKRIVLSLLFLLVLSGLQAQSARAEITAISGAPKVYDVALLEQSYKEHSLIRNKIASQLKWLWREERFLKDDLVYTTQKGDFVTNRQDEQQLLQVRQQIDGLRDQLTRENQALQVIGEHIPD